jgi:hypothetical protein
MEAEELRRKKHQEEIEKDQYRENVRINMVKMEE